MLPTMYPSLAAMARGQHEHRWPQLGKMTYSGPDNDKHLCIPEAVVKQWYHHPVYGRRFQSFMDSFQEEPPPSPVPHEVIILVM